MLHPIPRPSRATLGLALMPVLTVMPILPCAAAGLDAASVIVPWGDAAAAVAQAVTGLLLPLAVTAATAALARLAGPLRALVTATLVERLVRNVGDYAVNAVAGAVRGRTLSVPLGSAVIARAVQRGLDEAPAWLVRAAGGREGLAEKVFRSLPLAEDATIANTLRPAVEAARTGRPAP
nr:hypothetical protein NG677_09515 [Methylobacterium sp. OTU13CASTA1]